MTLKYLNTSDYHFHSYNQKWQFCGVRAENSAALNLTDQKINTIYYVRTITSSAKFHADEVSALTALK